MAKEKKYSQGINGKESFNKRRVICGIVVIVAAILLAVLLIPMLSNKTVTYRVLSAKQTISKGTMITRDNMETYLQVTNTTDKALAESGYDSADQLFNLYVKTDILPGMIVSKAAMTDISLVSSDLVPEGKQLVGMRVASVESAVGYMPKAGDIIRVYGLKTQEVVHVNRYGVLTSNLENDAFVYETLRYVEIYDVRDSNGDKVTESGNNPTNFIMIMDTVQIEQLIEAQSAGSVYLSLISSGDPARAKKLLDAQSNYNTAYEAVQSLNPEDLHSEQISVSLSFFNLTDYYPMPGDVVKFAYVAKTERTELDAKGELKTVKSTELVTPDTLQFVTVTDIVDASHKTIALTTSAAVNTVEAYKNDYKSHYVTLDLTEEQFGELTELVKNGNAFIYLVTTVDDPDYEKQRTEAMTAVRKARIDRILNGADEDLLNPEDSNTESEG